MAKKLTTIPTNLTEYPNSFKRLDPFPLEAYEIFYSMADAKEYAKNNPLAYVGQTIKVFNGNSVDSYLIIAEDGSLYSEKENRETYDQRITGLSTPSIPSDYADSNTNLRKDLNDSVGRLDGRIDTLSEAFDILEIDGGGWSEAENGYTQ